ncbi:MAG: amino acid adenylation domain-containing protein [Myxococcales bacterium]
MTALADPNGGASPAPSAAGLPPNLSPTASNDPPALAGRATDDETVFVQLPIDGQRSAAAGAAQFVPATVVFTANDELKRAILASGILEAPIDGARQAVLVGAFLALLHRFSQQSSVAVDVHVGAPPSPDATRALIRGAVTGAAPVLVTIGDVAQQLQASQVPVRTAGTAGLTDSARQYPNVAITFGQGPPLPSLGAPATRPLPAAAGTPAPGLAPAPIAYDLHLVFGSTASPTAALEPTSGPPDAPLLVVYDATLFQRRTVERLTDAFLGLLIAVLDDSTLPVHRLPVLDSADRHRMTTGADSGEASYPLTPVHRLFEDQARTQPNRCAATFKDQGITYAELDHRSNQLAHHLLSHGVTRGIPVAVCLLPSFDVLVALLAVFKAGGIYLPLDPTHPEALLASILDEAQPPLVLTQSRLGALTSRDRFSHFYFDRDWPAVETQPTTSPDAGVTLEHPAYQLYTSGTTGKPKGVVATHANLAHYIHVAQQKYGFRADDRFCSLARYTFSISMFELVSPLCCGGSLCLLERDDVLAPDRLARTLEQVTVVHAGPSLMGNLFRYLRGNPSAPRSFPRMRHASSGGDLVPPSVMEEMKAVFENAEIFVIYGCTEISCMGTTYPVTRDTTVARSLVGRPFPDVAVRLLDAHLELVPFGVVGEICFAGKGVVPGYFKRPELTAEKFIDREGRRFYRTGDMGRLHPDGNLEILGRRDFQVQVRGIRIELAGIENTIRELGLAVQCAVLVKKLDEFDVRLVAFLVNPQDPEGGITSLRWALAKRLPDYMLPQSLVVLDALPLTANGKLDRKALDDLPWQSPPPLTAATSPAAAARVAARDGVERNIAAAFSTCLGVREDAFGIDDNFFDLGGHSLLAVMLLDQLENKLGITLPPDVLFEHATVRALAAHSQGSFTSDPRPILLNANKDGPTLFVLVGVHLYRELARHLEPHYSVRAVYAGRELVMFDSPDRAPSVDELAREYVTIIRRHQPVGPYRLVGMSFGGIVAYEVARQFRQAGQEIAFLGLLDAVLPERGLRRRAAQLARLSGLSAGHLGELLTARAHRLVKALVDRGAPKDARGDFQKYHGEARLLPLEDQRQEAYRLATEDYVSRMGQFVGNVTLVVAAERMKMVLLQSPCLGWSDVVPGIRVRNVSADHLRLLENPHVREVAEIFLEALRAGTPDGLTRP